MSEQLFDRVALIGIGTLIFLGIGIFSAVGKTRSKDPS